MGILLVSGWARPFRLEAREWALLEGNRKTERPRLRSCPMTSIRSISNATARPIMSYPAGHPTIRSRPLPVIVEPPEYALHGTDVPWGVRHEFSDRCARLYPEDIERL